MISQSVRIGIDSFQSEKIRPLIVQTACEYESRIEIRVDNMTINAKSIMGLMAMPLEEGSIVSIVTTGNDEKDAIDAVSAILGK